MDPRRKKVIIDQRFTPPITVSQDEYQVVDPDNLFDLPSDEDNPDEETDSTPRKKHHHKHKNHNHRHHRHPHHHHHNHHKHHHFGGKQSLGGGNSHHPHHKHHHHKKDDHPVNRQDGKGKLSPPTNLNIIAEDIHMGAAKQQVIDITVKFDNVPNATKYNARVSKV